MPSYQRQCFADRERAPQLRHVVVNSVFPTSSSQSSRLHLRHQPDDSAGSPEYHIPPRVLARFGYTMASTVVLHHSETLPIVRSQSGACAATTAGTQTQGRRVRVVSQIRCLRHACLRHQPEDSAGVPGYPISPRVLARFGYWYTIASMVALHDAETPMVVRSRSGACAATTSRCRKYGICDTRVAKKAYLRHQSEGSAGVPGYPISPRVLARFGYWYTIASMVALHHAETLLVVLCRSGVCAATTSHRRKYGIWLICDTNLNVLRVHQDARYLPESWPVSVMR